MYYFRFCFLNSFLLSTSLFSQLIPYDQDSSSWHGAPQWNEQQERLNDEYQNQEINADASRFNFNQPNGEEIAPTVASDDEANRDQERDFANESFNRNAFTFAPDNSPPSNPYNTSYNAYNTPYASYNTSYNTPFAFGNMQQNDACQENCCNEGWDIWIYPDYFYCGLTQGDGIGFRRGYATLGLFTVPAFLSSSQFTNFIDVKGYAFVNGKWAASVGGGTRYLIPSWNVVLGANIYYDYRRLHHFHLHQIGAGLELLSPDFDIRVNGYFPVDSTQRESRLFDFSYGLFALRHSHIRRWYGVDTEVGAWLKRKYACDWLGLYLAAGPYYYTLDREHEHDHNFRDGRRRHDTFGGRVRLLARICDFVDASVNVTYDHIWRTRVNGQIMIALPFDYLTSLLGSGSRKNSCCCESSPCLLNQIAIQPVQRNGIIPAEQRCCWEWNWSEEGCSDCSSGRRPTSRSVGSSFRLPNSSSYRS
jgi:hypothetical protein